MWVLKLFYSLGVRNYFVIIYYILIINGSKVMNIFDKDYFICGRFMGDCFDVFNF